MLSTIVKPLGYCFIVLFAFLSSSIQAQHLGISASATFQMYASDIKDASDIRVDHSYDMGYYTNSGNPYSGTSSFGGSVLVERLAPNEKWSLATGLQYSVIISNISAGDGDYFFYRYSQSGQETRFLRVNSITQNVSCLGIPLQVRFFPFGGRKVRFYGKVTLENNFNVGTSGDVKFFQDVMEPYGDKVLESFAQPGSYNAIMSLAGGVRFQGTGHFAGGFEVIGPTGFLTPEALGMVSPTVGMGIQFNVVFFLKKSNDE